MPHKTPPEKIDAMVSLFIGEQFLTWADIAKKGGVSVSTLKRNFDHLAKTNRQIAERIAHYRQRLRQHREANRVEKEKKPPTQAEQDHIARVLDEIDDNGSAVRAYLRDELRPAYQVDHFQDPRK
jgi:AraC-like DNA-binding protein